MPGARGGVFVGKAATAWLKNYGKSSKKSGFWAYPFGAVSMSFHAKNLTNTIDIC
jgi:hypothetical protein